MATEVFSEEEFNDAIKHERLVVVYFYNLNSRGDVNEEEEEEEVVKILDSINDDVKYIKMDGEMFSDIVYDNMTNGLPNFMLFKDGISVDSVSCAAVVWQFFKA